MNCRFCAHPLHTVFIDLGTAPPSNSFLNQEELEHVEYFYPLKVFVCDNCFLVQVAEYKKAEDIFNSGYVYFSSFSKSWLEHARQYTEKIVERFAYNKDSLVVEIASNDGYLLQYFKSKGIPVLGIEPTLSTAKIAIEKGIESKVEFFGVELAQQLKKEKREADLLIGNNVLAHVPDLHDFVGGLKILLKSTGVITMEFPHLFQLVRHNQFDTIYQEHFSYFSLLTVQSIFSHHGLTIFDVEEISTHGGSLRIFVKHDEDSSKIISANVQNLIVKEKQEGMDSLSFYTGFQQSADKIKYELLKFLISEKQKGSTICAYGAAAKGNTLLNYCGIRQDLISFVVDASPHKQGKFLPGSRIPVLDQSRIVSEKPDFILILPWNIKDEIMAQLHFVSEWQARFVIAIPSLQIL